VNAEELAVALAGVGVSKRDYALFGVRPGSGAVYVVVDRKQLSRAGGLLLVPQKDGTWTIDISERGTQTTWRTFPREDAACRWMFDYLLSTM
jgi:hypothetical protein